MEFLAPYYSAVTVLDGVSSTWLEVPSGFPQGSILGPLFFVAFICDLPDVVLPGNTIALFADDCKISKVVDDASDQLRFQRDLDLHQWSIRNAMDFNVKKCKVSNYSLDNSLLEEVKEFKDLRVTSIDNFTCLMMSEDAMICVRTITTKTTLSLFIPPPEKFLQSY